MSQICHWRPLKRKKKRSHCPYHKLYLGTGEEYSMDPFRWNFVGKNLVCMAVEGFVYFILNLLIQYNFFLDHW